MAKKIEITEWLQTGRYIVDDKTGCWVWNRTISPNGYATVNIGAASKPYAHRILYEHYNGPIPVGHILLRSCAEPKCVNPAHYWVESYNSNYGDPCDELPKDHAKYTGPRYIVDDNGCWLWQHYHNNLGYPVGPRKFYHQDGSTYRKNMLQRRAIYFDHNGPIPAGGSLHSTCNMKSCVNPNHMVVRFSHSKKKIGKR